MKYESIGEKAPEAVTREQAERVAGGARQFMEDAGISQGELARRAGVASSTLSMFLTGMYGGNWQAMALDLDDFMERSAWSASRIDPLEAFVETRVAREVLNAGRMVMDRGGIALIHGDSGLGKTAALRVLSGKTFSVFISAATAKARIKAMLLDIGAQTHRHVGERSTADTFNRVVEALSSRKLLIVDEIHKFCGRGDECFDVLRDLYDATGVPQLWSGTTDLIRYFDRKIGQGREPLAQIRRRILVARDLNDLRTAKGEIFSAEEIRKLVSPGRWRLDGQAVRYMVQLANLRNEGGLGLVKNLYATAATLATAAKSEVITADTLRKAHGFQVSQRTRGMVESKLAAEARAAESQTSEMPEAQRVRATA